MPNMSQKKVAMPEQDPQVRNKNFEEVSLGYTEEMAIEEAQRCLKCKKPLCVEGCPVKVQIPDFIGCVAEGKFETAYEKIQETSSLPAVCGRVCPQESQCECRCIRSKKGEPVAIGRLERFVADWQMKNGAQETKKPSSNGIKIAVVGAGPAGLTCAGDLAKKGYEVTVFEAFHTPGGVLVYGIPEFRLPKEIVKKEIQKLEALGVTIMCNMVIGKVLSIQELLCEEGFSGVFIGTGAGLPSFMNIEGENLNGVYSANEFLTRINLMKAYRYPEYETPIYVGKKVAVIGGGNVAMDAARCAKRLGAEDVTVVYRRGADQMPARSEEIQHAKEEGINFSLLCNPLRMEGTEDGWVKGMTCIRMDLGVPDASGRKSVTPIEDSEFFMEADVVIVAIGQTPNPLIRSTTPDLETNQKGCILVKEETGKASKEGVWAGGDAVTGAATVILAMGAGKTAAQAMDEYFSAQLNL